MNKQFGLMNHSLDIDSCFFLVNCKEDIYDSK